MSTTRRSRANQHSLYRAYWSILPQKHRNLLRAIRPPRRRKSPRPLLRLLAWLLRDLLAPKSPRRLKIYKLSCFYPGELTEKQSLDHSIIMITANGDPLFIDRLKDIQRCITYLPGETWKIMDPVYYCRSCRAILARVATTDYVLLDLYYLDKIKAYPIEEGSKYTIRNYSVSVAHDPKSNSLIVANTGYIFTS